MYIANTRECSESERMPSISTSSSALTAVVASIVLSVLVVLAMAGVVIVIVFYCNKTKKLRKYDISQ